MVWNKQAIKMKYKVGDIVELIWLDVRTQIRKDKSDLMELKELKDLMVVTKSYGKILRLNKGFMLLIHEDSNEEVDYTILPTNLIIHVEVLKR